MEEKETLIMNVIAFSGESTSYSAQALEAARAGNFEEAELLLQKAEESMKTANKSSFELLQMEANDEHFRVTLLMVHAFDHLCSAEMEFRFAQETIKNFKMGGK